MELIIIGAIAWGYIHYISRYSQGSTNKAQEEYNSSRSIHCRITESERLYN